MTDVIFNKERNYNVERFLLKTGSTQAEMFEQLSETEKLKVLKLDPRFAYFWAERLQATKEIPSNQKFMYILIKYTPRYIVDLRRKGYINDELWFELIRLHPGVLNEIYYPSREEQLAVLSQEKLIILPHDIINEKEKEKLYKLVVSPQYGLEHQILEFRKPCPEILKIFVNRGFSFEKFDYSSFFTLLHSDSQFTLVEALEHDETNKKVVLQNSVLNNAFLYVVNKNLSTLTLMNEAVLDMIETIIYLSVENFFDDNQLEIEKERKDYNLKIASKVLGKIKTKREQLSKQKQR